MPIADALDGPRAQGIAHGDGWFGTSSGKTSISFTTQSESAPLVAAKRSATGAPLIRIAVVSTGVVNVNISVLSATERC